MPINVLIIREIDKYIRTESGGSHRIFAEKLRISQSTLSRHIRYMKKYGAPILYDYYRKTHYYEDNGCFEIIIRYKHPEQCVEQHKNNLKWSSIEHSVP